MSVPVWVWVVTVVGFVAVLVLDLLVVDRHPHEVTVWESARWVLFYIVLAVTFGFGVARLVSWRYAGEFFAGYITEYSLSVDNLFVFAVLMSALGVPRIHQHRVLLVGIGLALTLRGVFIALGAAAISRFEWIFYLFGAFLIWTAYRLAVGKTSGDQEYAESALLRAVRRVVPVADRYHGTKLVVKLDRRRFLTPMLIVMVAIGTTDLMFAVDSIPAVFGLTKQPYLVFTANAFALMGLRQLFFLLGGLLRRLVYLNQGLALVLGFIGAKLVSEALYGDGVMWAPRIGIGASLAVVAGLLCVTTMASMVKVWLDPSAVPEPVGAPARHR
ncbi:MAG: TerC/Alx family metal homeostasis membrane protein [Actinobacteria bacterium]|nr:TerC/Alx family metal homeostasis membrane protein [Actinomycetota bacterium]